MANVTKSKKAVRKPVARRTNAPKFSISPVTGLPVNAGRPGQKTVSRATLKAALADSV